MGGTGFFIGMFVFMGIVFFVIGIMLLVSNCKQSKKQKGTMKITATVVDKYVYELRHLHRRGGAQRSSAVHGTSTGHTNTYEYNDPRTGELKRTKNKWSSDEIKRQQIGDKVEIYVTPDGEALPPDYTKTTKLVVGILFLVVGVMCVLGVLAVLYAVAQLNSFHTVPFVTFS